MEPARALADLVEISPQIESALVVAADDEIVGSIGVPEGREAILARTLRDLLSGAASFRSEDRRVTQLHATLGDGELFAVTGADDRTIVAVADDRATPGLVFYDLKRCLAALAEPPAKPKPRRSPRRKKEPEAEA